MRWRNGPHGYGIVTKVLHWMTAAAITAQFAVGYSLDGGGRGRGRGRGRGGESGRGRGRGGEGFGTFGEDTLFTAHVVLGVTILVLVTARLLWRLTTPLPPWADRLSPTARRVAHRVEQALYVGLFAVPATGLALVASGEDDLVGIHVAAHVWFFVAVAAHLVIVLSHSTRRGAPLVRRML